VVSTNTITLQSQLINKDIPFVKKLLDSPSNACLVKGRRHYFCKMKAYHLESELEFSEDAQALNEILEWANSTSTGTVDELNFVPEANVWEKVASDADFCMSNQCVFFRDCFLQKARRAASEANILIVNHHVLFADLQLRYESGSFNENILLPPYQKIIFDEAHNIEKAAGAYFTHSFSKSGFYKFFSLYRGKRGKSFLKSFIKKMCASPSKALYAAGEYVEREVCGNLEQLYALATEELEKCDEYVRTVIDNEYRGGRLSINYRVLPQEWDSEEFREAIILPLRNIVESMDTLLQSMKQVNTFLDSLSDKKKCNTRRISEQFKVLPAS
jgi:Rad3-related DNA helicase